MNSFDEIQCEETPDHQWNSILEETTYFHEWMEFQDRKTQDDWDCKLSDLNAELQTVAA
jgi:hypothetical protein